MGLGNSKAPAFAEPIHTDIYGNREFVKYLRNWSKFFNVDANREWDLILIDYDDPANNVFEVTEGWAFPNGPYGTRKDVVFLINGIPVLVIECKNAYIAIAPPRKIHVVEFPAKDLAATSTRCGRIEARQREATRCNLPYLGNVRGGSTAQPSPFRAYRNSTRSSFSCSVNFNGLIAGSSWGFGVPPRS